MSRYNRILGLEEFQPKTEWVCFLPWSSEFGWYIMNHVKRIHGYNHPNKIVCIKKGHECLFPTATEFFYGWTDTVPDNKKGGVVKYPYNEAVKKVIIKKYGEDITFIDPADTSWEEKTSLAKHTFIPQNRVDHDFDIDIVITPRLRNIDKMRNYKNQWIDLADYLIKSNYKVAVCGSKKLSYDIPNAKYYSWDYIDVDTDVEMIRKSKLVISQESGLAYLTMMCEKPLIIIDECHQKIADQHRNHNIYFKNLKWAWNKKHDLAKCIKAVIGTNKGK